MVGRSRRELYYSPAHRQQHHDAKRQQALAAAGLPATPAGSHYQRVCWCGKPFMAKRPHARFCCDMCRTAAWKQGHAEASKAALERVPRGRLSGVQIPYRTFINKLSLIGLSTSDRIAVENLALDSLPAKQRARL